MFIQHSKTNNQITKIHCYRRMVEIQNYGWSFSTKILDEPTFMVYAPPPKILSTMHFTNTITSFFSVLKKNLAFLILYKIIIYRKLCSPDYEFFFLLMWNVTPVILLVFTRFLSDDRFGIICHIHFLPFVKPPSDTLP